MANYSYIAIDPRGSETRGLVDVADQHEAVRRIKEMGLFPTKVTSAGRAQKRSAGLNLRARGGEFNLNISIPGLGGRVKTARLAVFTRQLATLIEAGMPLLRGLRILQEQEENRNL